MVGKRRVRQTVEASVVDRHDDSISLDLQLEGAVGPYHIGRSRGASFTYLVERNSTSGDIGPKGSDLGRRCLSCSGTND
jgi:hypothetical protein